ncbi:GNAT family N-acetyltransferase [Rouxiella sp. WC2420]|uniref:GNAT family N-acetyltransferase n=1 Tax=Rouxiella sp. WC2420 TaxID=3234145 RepID=A0AB39VXB9_9GAMM
MTEQCAKILPEIILREMTAADLTACHGLSQAVSWSHRLEDWQLAFHCGKGWVAESAGQVLGSAIYWRWGSESATLGLVIVSPDCQGRGVGKALLNTLIGKLDGSKIRLHATPEGKPLYEKLGFVTTGGIRQQQSRELPVITAPELENNCRFRPLGVEDVNTLSELDTLSSGMRRPALYQALLDPQSPFCMEKGLLLTRDDKPAGFALLRKFGRGYNIGPVIAASLDDAKALIQQLLSESNGKFMRLDVEAESGLAEWLETLGLPCVDRPTTMYKDGHPPVSAEGWCNFVLATQALA